MRSLCTASLFLSFGVACAQQPKPEPAQVSPVTDVTTTGALAEADVPADWMPAVERGNTAIRAFGRQLRERLMAEMKAGGPSQAIGVCRDEAQPITRQIAQAHRLKLGRTSLKLRNTGNAAPGWLEPYLKEVWGRPADQVDVRVFDLETAVGVARPIPMGSACVKCHGSAENIDPQVKAVLAEAFPGDQATGFEPGQLRGLFWAEVPKVDAPQLPTSMPTKPIP